MTVLERCSLIQLSPIKLASSSTELTFPETFFLPTGYTYILFNYSIELYSSCSLLRYRLINVKILCKPITSLYMCDFPLGIYIPKLLIKSCFFPSNQVQWKTLKKNKKQFHCFTYAKVRFQSLSGISAKNRTLLFLSINTNTIFESTYEMSPYGANQ